MEDHQNKDGSIRVFQCKLEDEGRMPNFEAYEIPVSCMKCGKTVVMSAFMFDGQEVYCAACRAFLRATV